MVTGNMNLFYCLCVLLTAVHGVGATCNYDADFFPYTWYSSNGGTLNITRSTISGFKVYTFGSFVFTCVLNIGTQYISKSTVFYRYNLPFEAFLCMDARRQSSNKYTYYQPTSELTDAGNIRMKIFLEGKTISSITDVCDVTDFTTLTSHIMVKEDTISTEKITCPTALQAMFTYTFDSGSGNSCTGDTSLDVCTDTSKLKYDYTKCLTDQAYSTGGEVNCVYSTTSGGYTYLHVYNLDTTTDETTTYRFTCYAISTSGTTVYATQYPQDCYYGQNSTYVESSGATLVFTLSSACETDSDTTVIITTSSASLGIVLGVLFAFLAIFVAVVFIIWFCWKKKRNEERKRMELEAMENGLPDENMYDVDRLMYTPDHLLTPTHVHPKITGKVLDKSFEGYADDEYMDDFGWQDMVDSTDYMGMRKRHIEQDEFEVGEAKSISLKNRVKNLMKSKKKKKEKKGKKKKKKPKKSKNTDTEYETESEEEVDGVQDLQEKQKKELNLIVNGGIPGDEIDGDPVFKKSRYTDDDKTAMRRKLKKDIDDIESVSGIIDQDLMAGDLDTVRSFEDSPKRVPRLVLPNLRETSDVDTDAKQKKKKKRRVNTKTASQKPMTLRSFRKRKVNAWLDDNADPLPLYCEDPKLKGLPVLQRVHRKKNQQLWSDILNKFGHDFPELDFKSKRKNMSENRWRKLLEELYTDKKYFDYVKKSSRGKGVENELQKKAEGCLDYLYDRANFWEDQKPIPPRPATNVPVQKPKRKKSPRHRMPPSTPMTQVRLDSMNTSFMNMQMQRESTI